VISNNIIARKRKADRKQKNYLLDGDVIQSQSQKLLYD
jgi:hypothetical protein